MFISFKKYDMEAIDMVSYIIGGIIVVVSLYILYKNAKKVMRGEGCSSCSSCSLNCCNKKV